MTSYLIIQKGTSNCSYLTLKPRYLWKNAFIPLGFKGGNLTVFLNKFCVNLFVCIIDFLPNHTSDIPMHCLVKENQLSNLLQQWLSNLPTWFFTHRLSPTCLLEFYLPSIPNFSTSQQQECCIRTQHLPYFCIHWNSFNGCSLYWQFNTEILSIFSCGALDLAPHFSEIWQYSDIFYLPMCVDF